MGKDSAREDCETKPSLIKVEYKSGGREKVRIGLYNQTRTRRVGKFHLPRTSMLALTGASGSIDSPSSAKSHDRGSDYTIDVWE
eukprot:271202-Hanusia_phi.AAC.7